MSSFPDESTTESSNSYVPDVHMTGTFEATCAKVSFHHPDAADAKDAAFFESKGCPPVVGVTFTYSVGAAGMVVRKRIGRRYDVLQPEGRAALEEIARRVLGKGLASIADLALLEGRPCSLVLTIRTVEGKTSANIATVLAS